MAENGYLHFSVAELVVKRDDVAYDRASFSAEHAFSRVAEYGIALVVPIHHVPRSVQGLALKKNVQLESQNDCDKGKILHLHQTIRKASWRTKKEPVNAVALQHWTRSSNRGK